MTPRAGRAIAWLLGLVAIGTLLRLAATGDLASPPLGALGDLTRWAGGREPVAAAIALVRLAAEASVWYVLAVSGLHALSSGLRVAGGRRLADALAVPAVRRLVHAGLGIGLAAASSVGGRDQGSAAGTATMAPVADAPLATEPQIDDGAGTASMRPQVGDHGGVAQVAPAPTTWTVAPGESLWSIAEELLGEVWQRPPSEAEIDPVWRQLVERNRARLVDPADPDLIHAGQVLDVPPLPSPAG